MLKWHDAYRYMYFLTWFLMLNLPDAYMDFLTWFLMLNCTMMLSLHLLSNLVTNTELYHDAYMYFLTWLLMLNWHDAYIYFLTWFLMLNCTMLLSYSLCELPSCCCTETGIASHVNCKCTTHY
jgi:hypothetical protein